MGSPGVNVKNKFVAIIFLFVLYFNSGTKALDYEEYIVLGNPGKETIYRHEIKTLGHDRQRRDTPPAPATAEKQAVTTQPPATNVTVYGNSTEDSNKTKNETQSSFTTMTAVVTQTPLLGVNGSGTLKVKPTNMPKVSEPIMPDDSNVSDVTEMLNETPERIKAAQNITNLTYDSHSFYNSSFIGNVTYFNEYWANISRTPPRVHDMLSNSHRRATALQLSFKFPFYGHYINNVTVATGGFIYTGEHVHNWLAATQYIAPLMANFDTTIGNDSFVKMYDDDEKLTVLWENVVLQENLDKKFTFAATLYKNGDIIFAYKTVPIDVQEIQDSRHPVKVGISDAYLSDKIVFYVRRKTIFEYHRVNMKDRVITNNTLIIFKALPTCLQYNSCESCVNHETGFNCTWCSSIQRCSSGNDRNKQDWLIRNCQRTAIANETLCPSATHIDAPADSNGNTAYTTDTQEPPNHVTEVKTQPSEATPEVPKLGTPDQLTTNTVEQHSAVGGVVAAFVTITLICFLVGWVLYAFKNPHTRSGQLLIKYRPSQWNWRRGEARYTAATIHM